MNQSPQYILKTFASIGIQVTDDAKFAELLGDSASAEKLVQIATQGRRDGVQFLYADPAEEGIATKIRHALSIPESTAKAIAVNLQRSI